MNLKVDDKVSIACNSVKSGYVKGIVQDIGTQARLILVKDSDGASSWHFLDTAVQWSSDAGCVSRVAFHLSSLKELRAEGHYCPQLKQWKRMFLTKCGIAILLVEDVPEAGGQNCIWGAGLVMARYLEHQASHLNLANSSILELGAGCGLTSMVAALLGARVFATEQTSCIPYLSQNIALNNIPVNIRTLHWANASKNMRFPLILGCDITYDPSFYADLFATFSSCLTPQGKVLLCHDNDSCPLSSHAYDELVQLAIKWGFQVVEIPYIGIVEDEYCSDLIKIWEITFIS